MFSKVLETLGSENSVNILLMRFVI